MTDQTNHTALDFMTWSYPGHNNAYLGEVFAQFVKLKDKDAEERVQFLRDYATIMSNNPRKLKGFRIALEALFHPSVRFDLFEGMPKTVDRFHKHPDKVAGTLFKSLGSVGYFLMGSPDLVKDLRRREHIFLQILENLYEGEAYLLVALKDKNASFVPGLTQELAHAAFPQWIPAPIAAEGFVSTVIRKIEESAPVKRGRGRPKGAKNKPKVQEQVTTPLVQP